MKTASRRMTQRSHGILVKELVGSTQEVLTIVHMRVQHFNPVRSACADASPGSAHNVVGVGEEPALHQQEKGAFGSCSQSFPKA